MLALCQRVSLGVNLGCHFWQPFFGDAVWRPKITSKEPSPFSSNLFGLSGSGGQHVCEGLEDGATVSCEMLSLHNLLTFGNVQISLTLHSLNRRFLSLDAERGDQWGQLLDVNHNQNSFAILLRKATLIGRCRKRHGFDMLTFLYLIQNNIY